MQVVFTASAQSDLEGIRTYIGEHNPYATSRLSVQIVAACDRLEHLSARGRPGLIPRTREITVWP